MQEKEFRDDLRNYLINEWAEDKIFQQKNSIGIDHYLDAHERAIEILHSVPNNIDEAAYRENLLDKYNEYQWVLDSDDNKSYTLDPDWRAKRKFGGHWCNADGLHSFKKISQGCDQGKYYEDDISKIFSVYEHYRKVPIFYFPPMWDGHNGINNSRGNAYHDRIDLFLFDLKTWFDYLADLAALTADMPSTLRKEKEDALRKEAEEICSVIMIKCYEDKYTDTKEWLDNLTDEAKNAKEKGYNSGFDYLMDKIYNVKGIFVDNEYNVFNIETDELINKENWDRVKKGGWTRDFYDNLKKKIDEWYERQGFFCDQSQL